MEDSYRHRGLRKLLIAQLKEKGIQDERVLEAMLLIPRHFFLEKAFEEWAYTDKAFPIGKEQTISQPYTVAYQTSLLEVKKGDKILEIGTGSGYQAAVLSVLGASVYTVERQETLFQEATALLKILAFPKIHTFFSDGNDGLPQHALFDKILFTAGAKEVPSQLLKQLQIGGIMVIPIGNDEQQTMYKIVKLSDTEFSQQSFAIFSFVPFLQGVNKS